MKEELLKTQDKLLRTQDKLLKTQDKLLKTQEELVKTRKELSSIQQFNLEGLNNLFKLLLQKDITIDEFKAEVAKWEVLK